LSADWRERGIPGAARTDPVIARIHAACAKSNRMFGAGARGQDKMARHRYEWVGSRGLYYRLYYQHTPSRCQPLLWVPLRPRRPTAAGPALPVRPGRNPKCTPSGVSVFFLFFSRPPMHNRFPCRSPVTPPAPKGRSLAAGAYIETAWGRGWGRLQV